VRLDKLKLELQQRFASLFENSGAARMVGGEIV
jgi:hypothetical protein